MLEFTALLDGYRRFRAGAYEKQKERFDHLASEGQSPKAMIIACSDSRVDPAQIFDVDPALVPPFETSPGHHGVSAALEFAVQVLKVREIVVMGHGLCGGCKAALTQELHGTEPGRGGFIADWIAMLNDVRAEVVQAHGTEGRAAERAMEQAGVRASLINLRTFPCIREKEEAGEINLRGAFFAISDGVLHLLDEPTSTFRPAV
jgi:carbonic anhydrase